MKVKNVFAVLLLVGGVTGAAGAEASAFRLDGVFGDHMVLQRNRPIRFSGTAPAGMSVRAVLGETSVKGVADSDGRWTVDLPAMREGGPYEVRFELHVPLMPRAISRFTLRDVMVGEVWVASGQSNMEFWVLGHNLEAPPFYHLPDGEEAAAYRDGDLRLLYVPRMVAPDGPGADLPQECSWKRAETREANGCFSAVGFWFGRELRRLLGAKVPVGVVSAAWGGTRIEPWTPEEVFRETDDVASLKQIEKARSPEERGLSEEQVLASALARFYDWERKFFATDPATTAKAYPGWAAKDLDESEWHRGSREEMTGLQLPGVTWYRFAVDVPAGWSNDVRLEMSFVDDCDETYFDGRKVGETGTSTPKYWMAPRSYRLGKVEPGRHVIAVRLISHFSSGAFGENLDLVDGASGAKVAFGSGTWCERVEFHIDEKRIGRRPDSPLIGVASSPRFNMQLPSTLYNGMIAPITAMNVGGAIWYQGCSNLADGEAYVGKQRRLIAAWRKAFRHGEMPFLITQLSAKDDYPRGKVPADFWQRHDMPWKCIGFGRFRLVQDLLRDDPFVGIATTVDVGDIADIHPPDKRSVGSRLAREAMRVAFGDRSYLPGPRGAKAVREGDAVVVSFANAGSGLRLVEGAPKFHPHLFAVAGRDKIAHWADGELLDDGRVRVTCPAVKDPMTVQYCVSGYPPGIAFRRTDDGLPVYPFELPVAGAVFK